MISKLQLKVKKREVSSWHTSPKREGYLQKENLSSPKGEPVHVSDVCSISSLTSLKLN
jgi:hypothetical protein